MSDVASIENSTEVLEAAPPETAPPARVEESAKLRQIFVGAREVFLRDGFDGASVNDIARAGGVSKGTVYAYFDSKEQLFEALMIFDRQRQAEQICQFDSDNPDVRAVLLHFGTDLMETMLKPEHMAHLRMVIGIASRFPQIGRSFYEAGPAFAIEKLANYLRAKHDMGLLDVADTELAARQFIELCKVDIFLISIFSQSEPKPRAEIEIKIARALDMFLSYYGNHGSLEPNTLFSS